MKNVRKIYWVLVFYANLPGRETNFLSIGYKELKHLWDNDYGGFSSKTTVYICKNMLYNQPVTEISKLVRQLEYKENI